MADQQRAGRGRARGRARGGAPGQQQPGQQREDADVPELQVPVQSVQQPPAGAWGRELPRGVRQRGGPASQPLPTPCCRATYRLAGAGGEASGGSRVKLSANYFKLLQQPRWCLWKYRVDFTPEEYTTSEKKRLLYRGTQSVLAAYIFDGSVLYTSTRNHEAILQVNDAQNKNVRVTIRLVGDVAAGDYHYLQVFNIIMRKCLGFLNLQLMGRNFFDAVAKVSIPEHRLELWPGYITSIRQHEKDILLCCEITHKVMRHDTVLQLLVDCTREDRANYKRLFQSRIVGAIVLTEYNNRTYRIDDVDFNSTPASTFTRRDGTSISYAQYFRDRYNLRITQMGQPMLVSRAKAREIRAGMSETVYLAPELCRMTGLTDTQRANCNLMRALAEHTRIGPSARVNKLLEFSTRLRDNPQILNELRRWDLGLANNLIELPGRILPPETIRGGRATTYSAGNEANWTKEVHSHPMLHLAPITVWAVVYPSRCKNAIQLFVQMLQRAARGMNWQLPLPNMEEIRDDRPVTYLDGLEATINRHSPQLIMCVVSNNKADRYAAIKKKCCVDRAVPTQVIVAKKLEGRTVMSLATKVVIQLNCKLGGAPWSVVLPYKTMMVVGYDVCHDTNHKERSYGALVASLNNECVRYFSTVTPHTNGEELSNDFALNIVKACRKWQGIHGSLPEKILIYRDGVGDGQLGYVFQHEVQTIKKKLAELYGGEDEVKMTFIVVSKRINSRIFMNNENPPPGTVVDDVITLPERYDFFIVSQCVRQGTVSPTSYNILFDSMGQSADRIQRLTYKLTHMYFNWSGTVSVPAPCQYAHKLACLVAQSLHRNPNAELETVLYFL